MGLAYRKTVAGRLLPLHQRLSARQRFLNYTVPFIAPKRS
jgi:hypothetical protein